MRPVNAVVAGGKDWTPACSLDSIVSIASKIIGNEKFKFQVK